MADESNSLIIKYLISRQLPFSVILDGSSDVANNHVVLVYFQLVEGTRTVVLFFSILKLGKSSRAPDYVKALQQSVIKHGPQFENYFKSNLVAVITDGENTMLSFQNLMNDWVRKKGFDGTAVRLIKVNCLAHKIQLISRGSLIPMRSDKDYGPRNCLNYFVIFESLLNHLYGFIKGASRRLGEMREINEENRLPKVELVKLFPNRWISSEDKTLSNLHKGYKAVVLTLKKIIEDTTNYKGSVSKESTKILNTITDKRFLIISVYLRDYTFAFRIWSQLLQRPGALLVDQYEPYQAFFMQ
jgi:hypothetical protein